MNERQARWAMESVDGCVVHTDSKGRLLIQHGRFGLVGRLVREPDNWRVQWSGQGSRPVVSGPQHLRALLRGRLAYLDSVRADLLAALQARGS